MSDDPKTPAPKRPGGVQRDGQGNVSWKWEASSGTGNLDSTSKLLKALDAPELKIESETPPIEQQKVERKDAIGGYDPYGRPLQPAKPAGKPTASARKPEPASESPRSLWSRWLSRR